MPCTPGTTRRLGLAGRALPVSALRSSAVLLTGDPPDLCSDAPSIGCPWPPSPGQVMGRSERTVFRSLLGFGLALNKFGHFRIHLLSH